MASKAFHICSTPDWEEIFSLVLSKCDELHVVLPEGDFDIENPLMGGKLELEKLAQLKVLPWDGTENASKLTGKLGDTEKNILYKMMEPSFDGEKPTLWQFSIIRDSSYSLTISDFTECILKITPELESLLLKNGLDLDSLSGH
ncbi:hypothetical protein ACFFIX_14060 [Metabacillus herbersteinensis]|uniref:Uncharacterized protein n=1 Tax=Metabacillus herbersteinensis TaxID=283816 RepID=A0ABV6GFU7_9BACI